MAVEYSYHPAFPGVSHSRRISSGDRRVDWEREVSEMLLPGGRQVDPTRLRCLTDLELSQLRDMLQRVTVLSA